MSHLPNLPPWSDVKAFYINLTTHKIPGPRSLSYFLVPLLLYTALLIPPSTLSAIQLRTVFLPLILALTLDAWRAMQGPDVISVTALLWSVVLLWAYDPRRDFKRWSLVSPEHKNAGSGQAVWNAESYPAKLGKRMKWVGALLLSQRFSNWRIGNAKHDATQPFKVGPGRAAKYVRRALKIFLLNYFILDMACYVSNMDPYFHVSGWRVDVPPPELALVWTNRFDEAVLGALWRWLPPRLVRSAALAGECWPMVSGMFLLPTVPVVGLSSIGLWPEGWSPHEWPDMIGPFSAVWKSGIRGLWGTWWHQTTREVASAPGAALSKWLFGTAKDRWLPRYMVTVIVAFGASGLLHLGMIPSQPLGSKLTANQMRLYLGGFFWSQPVGFAVELLPARMTRRLPSSLQSSPLAGLATLIWVTFWLCLTLP